ncbi:MAG: sulfatase-like hydrolase/transferase, partial [Deltaproteobacteria bacterium]|nr:sulfatase-like hydrolase/transferase [Deltaproteobacteria bacterium]
MKIGHRRRPALAPAAVVLCVALVSLAIYELSANIGNAIVHERTARMSGTVYFLAVAFGAFWVWLVASLDDAPVGSRVLAALATPFLWMTKECARLLESHPAAECLYYYVNPLNLMLALLIVVELAAATLVARAIEARRGGTAHVLTPAPILAIAAALTLGVTFYAGGRGESTYATFLAGYRAMFGPGYASDAAGEDRAAAMVGETRAAGDPAAGAANSAGASDANARRPNIVFILGDNHNADTMGCAGHPVIETPAMDRLAREGVRFENTFNTTSLCSPSRASILTGTYAHSHGVLNNHTSWTARMPTFLEQLGQAGYATAFIGKWHMPGEGLPKLPFLDLFVSYTYREGQGSYFNCPMIVNGREVPSRKPYITAETTDYAIEFIEQTLAAPAAERRPFVVYLSQRPGHPPYEAPVGIDGMYDKVDVAAVLPPGVDSWWFGKTRGNVFQGVMMGSYYDQYRGYLETLTAMDADIGRLLTRIDELGLAANTAVVYMADNGMRWGTHGSHGIREPYEDVARLPLIVRAPWLVPDPGTRRRQLALNIDIAPTFLELAGIAPPAWSDG